MTRIGAYIALGIMSVLLMAIGWSNWSFGSLEAEQARVLAVYRPSTSGNQLMPVKKWAAGTEEGEAVLTAFCELYRNGTLQEQNLFGSPDYVLILGYEQQTWAVQVYGEWFSVFRPNFSEYTVLVDGWQEFRQEYLEQQPGQEPKIPFKLDQTLDGYMHQRMSENLGALNTYLLPESYYKLSQLKEQSPDPENIRGYEVKAVETTESGNYIVILRVFGTQPARTWEEEYEAYPMVDRFKLFLIGRREYVAVHP